MTTATHQLHRVLLDIVDERRRQDTIFGEQNHRPTRWIAIAGEEFGEVCEAAMKYDAPELDNPDAAYEAPIDQLGDAYYRECIHQAAVLAAMAECYLRNGGDS